MTKISTTKKYEQFFAALRLAINKDPHCLTGKLIALYKVDSYCVSYLKQLGIITERPDGGLIIDNKISNAKITQKYFTKRNATHKEYREKKAEEQKGSKQLTLDLTPKSKKQKVSKDKNFNHLADLFQIGTDFNIPNDRLGEFSKRVNKLFNKNV